MKDLTKEEIKGIIKESNKDLLDEIYIDDEARIARVNHLDTYAHDVTQAAGMLNQLVENAAMDRESGNLSDSDLEYLMTTQVERMYAIVATVENSLRAIKEGTYQRPGNGNIIYPISFKD